MVYSLVYSNQAQRDLQRIDRSISVRILKKIDYFLGLADPFVQAKQLTGFEMPTYRFRIGDYRIVFRKDQKSNCLVILVVLSVSHRKEVYKKL